jgi:hypothetical protein
MMLADATGSLETIVVRPSGGRLSLSEVSTIIRDCGGDLVATAPMNDPTQHDAYRLRVRTGDLDALVAALAARGHCVVAGEGHMPRPRYEH